MSAQKKTVVSVDPIYQFSADQIQSRIDATYPKIIELLLENQQDYVWTRFASAGTVGKHRMKTMKRFLADYQNGKEKGRYIACSLPTLPFKEKWFDIALCSHFLFLYSEQLSVEFHCRSIQEMLKAAKEVRIFSLLTLGCQPSPHLDSVCRFLRKSGYRYKIQTVDYEFQKGGNQMLTIR